MRVLPRSDRVRVLLAGVITLAVVLPLGAVWWSSMLAGSHDPAQMGYADYGGGSQAGHSHHGIAGIAVPALVETRAGLPDRKMTLTVEDDGDRITVNGRTPGPTLRFTRGELVEVTLVNRNIADGTSLHWHGLDVPNAMDGVAGVTQDAVRPGERFVYRFVAGQAGTYWYHSHQVSHAQVSRGLFGALVIEQAPARDVVAVLHQYADATLNGSSGTTAVPVEPGETVRVRVVNTDNALTPVWVTGAPYRIVAIDGTDLNAPTPVTGRSVTVPAGGRADLQITAPETGVRIDFGGTTALVLGPDPAAGTTPPQPAEPVDLLSYGAPADPGLDTRRPDRSFAYEIGRRPGFLDGRPGMWWTINGHLYPDLPMFMVEEGDVVVTRIENRSGEPHPMHLHGHHALVLSRNGVAATGGPWWVDSLEVSTGQSFEIAFRADNPGIWMDHCHNLPHASEGLVAHLMYAGVTTPFRIGEPRQNHPE